jgi:hypothetical protein
MNASDMLATLFGNADLLGQDRHGNVFMLVMVPNPIFAEFCVAGADREDKEDSHDAEHDDADAEPDHDTEHDPAQAGEPQPPLTAHDRKLRDRLRSKRRPALVVCRSRLFRDGGAR